MSFTDGWGRPAERPVSSAINTDDFVDTPGHALLILAANRHLSISDLWRLLGSYGIERTPSWIRRRRWLFLQPGEGGQGPKTNADGRDQEARSIIDENVRASLRDLVRLLKDKGIIRSREWVRMNRSG